jgi:hypothetical protein
MAGSTFTVTSCTASAHPYILTAATLLCWHRRLVRKALDVRASDHRRVREPLLTSNGELLNSLPTVFGDIDIAHRVHRDAVRLVELTRKMSDRTAET